MKRRDFATMALFVATASFAVCDESYTAKSLANALPRAADFGGRWQPVHPKRWLTDNQSSVTAMYDRRAGEPGKVDASVIIDCFVYKSENEAKRALKAKRAQIAAYPSAVITEEKGITLHAFSSHHKGEEKNGNRVSFAIANVVFTISPSPLSTKVAEQVVKHLHKKV